MSSSDALITVCYDCQKDCSSTACSTSVLPLAYIEPTQRVCTAWNCCDGALEVQYTRSQQHATNNTQFWYCICICVPSRVRYTYTLQDDSNMSDDGSTTGIDSSSSSAGGKRASFCNSDSSSTGDSGETLESSVKKPRREQSSMNDDDAE